MLEVGRFIGFLEHTLDDLVKLHDHTLGVCTKRYQREDSGDLGSCKKCDQSKVKPVIVRNVIIFIRSMTLHCQGDAILV